MDLCFENGAYFSCVISRYMNIDIDGFELLVPKVIWLRGMDIYSMDRVSKLTATGAFSWQASVQGGQLYTTRLELEGDEIVAWRCDCPFEGEICKHVVAMALELAAWEGEEMLSLGGDGSFKGRMDGGLEKLAMEASKEDLAAFVVDRALADGDFRNAFLLAFSSSGKKKSNIDYKKIVNGFIVHSEGKWDWLDDSELGKSLDNMVAGGRMRLRREEYGDAFFMCKAILDIVPSNLEMVDENGFQTIGAIVDAASLLRDLLEEPLPESLAEMVKRYCASLFERRDMQECGLEDRMWEVFGLGDKPVLGAELILESLERNIERLDSEGEGWRLVWEFKKKAELLLSLGRKEEYRAFCEERVDHQEMRELLVDFQLQDESREVAKELVAEGLRLAKLANDRRHAEVWQRRSMEFARKEGDVGAVRKHAFALFRNSGYGNFSFYDSWKATFQSEDWLEALENLIEELKEEDSRMRGQIGFGGYALLGNATALAEIYARESMPDRLLLLLGRNRNNFTFLFQYGPALEKDYAAELRALYREAIRAYAERETGRSSYHRVVDMLKSLKKVRGGDEDVVLLLQTFRKLYKRRYAMMEILGLAFPVRG